MSGPPVIIVHEPTPYWCPLLQRAFLGSRECDVRCCPHIVDLLARVELPEAAACLIVFENGGPGDVLLELLPVLASMKPTIILSPRVDVLAEWHLRELGVALWVESPIPVSQLVRIVRRRLQSSQQAHS